MATGNCTRRGRLAGGTWGWNAPPQFLPGQKIVGQLLQAAGYRTGLFGKLHFGGEFEKKPGGGPDFAQPMTTGPIQWGFSYSYVLLGTRVKGVTQMTPHTDMVHEVDVVVGKLVEGLEKRRLLDKTLIVVTSDNGGIPSDRASGHDAVGGLRGSKSHIWEGGHRVPFVVHWKGRVPAGAVRNQVIGTHDIVPTFVQLAHGRFEPDQMLDSVSLAPVLLGKRGDDQPVRQTLLIQSSPGRDALAERDPELPKRPKTGPKMTPQERQAAMNKAWNEIAKKGRNSGSDGAAHALREGPWKLVFNIEPCAVELACGLAHEPTCVLFPKCVQSCSRPGRRSPRGRNQSLPAASWLPAQPRALRLCLRLDTPPQVPLMCTC